MGQTSTSVETISDIKSNFDLSTIFQLKQIVFLEDACVVVDVFCWG